MFSIEQDKNGKFYVKTLKPKSKNRLDYRYNSKKKKLEYFDEEYQKEYQKYTKEIINRKNEVFDLIKILPKNKQPEKAIFTDEEIVEICKSILNKCCEELNTYVDNFKQKSIKEPQNNKLPFDECVSGGINAINEIKSILEINQDVTGLKKAFKKTLIQKKYHIDNNEISDNCDKLFRKDEKYLKRIKIFGSHLFSKKATIKGKINKLVKEFVNNENKYENFDKKGQGGQKKQYDLLVDSLDFLFSDLEEQKLLKPSKQKKEQICKKASTTLNTINYDHRSMNK